MPNSYTPTAVALPGTITEPIDGEPRTTASVVTITRPLANAIAYVTEHMPVLYTHTDETLTTIFSTDSDTYVTAESNGVYVDVPSCRVGDKILVNFGCMWRQANGTANHALFAQLLGIDNHAGTPTPLAIPGSLPSVLIDHRQRLALSGVHTVAVAGLTRITFRAKVQEAGVDDFFITGGLALTALRVRP